GPQAHHEGRGFPVAMRYVHDQALALRTATVRPGQVGAGPGFVDENERFRMECGLPGFPRVAALFHVGTILLARPDRLFFRVSPSTTRARARVARDIGKRKR